MALQYSITINNRAATADTLMVFQNDPGSWSPNALSLAWFTKFSNPSPTAKVRFTWSLDVGLSWADTGVLAPGVDYVAAETYDPTAYNNYNEATLDYNGAYLFKDFKPGPDPLPRLYLSESGNIPSASAASVGVTMAGSTIYATQAKPNQKLTFSLKPSYFLAYGSFEEGQVLNVSAINNPLQLTYPNGVYALETTLNRDYSWTPPVSSAIANAERMKLLSR